MNRVKLEILYRESPFNRFSPKMDSSGKIYKSIQTIRN